MIYANSREIRQADMDEVQKWILSLIKPEDMPTTRAIKRGFISEELLTRYCKLIGHKYPEHICSKCNEGDKTIAEILFSEIKPMIQVVKIGLTRDMIIPEDIDQQLEIPKIELPSFYANKRIIGLSTIIQELANNYLQGNTFHS